MNPSAGLSQVPAGNQGRRLPFPENQVVDPALAVDYAKIACQHIRDAVGVSVLEYTQDLQKLITVNNYIAGHCDKRY